MVIVDMFDSHLGRNFVGKVLSGKTVGVSEVTSHESPGISIHGIGVIEVTDLEGNVGTVVDTVSFHVCGSAAVSPPRSGIRKDGETETIATGRTGIWECLEGLDFRFGDTIDHEPVMILRIGKKARQFNVAGIVICGRCRSGRCDRIGRSVHHHHELQSTGTPGVFNLDSGRFVGPELDDGRRGRDATHQTNFGGIGKSSSAIRTGRSTDPGFDRRREPKKRKGKCQENTHPK
mmetsp:Transcript_19587/g.45605  ORF Transcript_19587/g.45605 Transcript_19587/m.45605 type:complete len:233 (+) Transcript_19587:1787-2485(+)